MLRLLLIRHAAAEDRESWPGPDRDRPLTKKGFRQADAIAALLVARLAESPRAAAGRKAPPAQSAQPPLSAPAVRSISTSPALRCIQTIQPLARAFHEPFVVDPRLDEGRAIPLPDEAGAHILCAHGDNIPALLDALGVTWSECRKGSMWELTLDGEACVVESEYIPPPQH